MDFTAVSALVFVQIEDQEMVHLLEGASHTLYIAVSLGKIPPLMLSTLWMAKAPWMSRWTLHANSVQYECVWMVNGFVNPPWMPARTRKTFINKQACSPLTSDGKLNWKETHSVCAGFNIKCWVSYFLYSVSASSIIKLITAAWKAKFVFL